MKKKIGIILSIWIIASLIFAITYIKQNPKPKKLELKPITTGAKAAKEPFKSIGKEISKIALNNDKYDLKPFTKQLLEKGATNVVIQTHINSSPIKKHFQQLLLAVKSTKI